jgi:hypothetical protein
MVETLYKKQFVDKKLKRKLIVENAIAPSFYILPKIHKLDIPFSDNMNDEGLQGRVDLM